MSIPGVYVILLNWNSWVDTLVCLKSLTLLNYPNFSVVVVDNASTDESLQRLEHSPIKIDLIQNFTNEGFAEGNNIGIRYALDNQSDYVFLLNNDTIITDPDLLSKMVEVAERDPSIGLLSPTIYYDQPINKVWYAGSELNLWLGWRHRFDVPKGSSPVDTGYASGCCVLAPSRFIREVGFLNKNYFLTVEDVEWSLRARRAGWRVVYVPHASLFHKISRSTIDVTGKGAYSPTRVYYEHRNTIWLVRKYGNRVQKWVVWPIRFVIHWNYKIAGYVLLRKWIKLKSLIKAIRDGLRESPNSMFYKIPELYRNE